MKTGSGQETRLYTNNVDNKLVHIITMCILSRRVRGTSVASTYLFLCEVDHFSQDSQACVEIG